MTPATKHLYDPSLGANFAEDLCDDHVREALEDDPCGRTEVTTAEPGTPCKRCADETP